MTVVIVVFLACAPVLAHIHWDEWRARRSFDAHVADAIEIFDDGKALVREVEDMLREAAR